MPSVSSLSSYHQVLGRSLWLAGALALAGACGPPAVQLRPAKTCDSGSIEDCRSRCDKNESRACYRLGWFTEEGQGVKPSLRRALELYDKACTSSYAVACRALAMVYEHGDDDLEPNKKKSEEYYARACGLGLKEACIVKVYNPPPAKAGSSGIGIDAPDVPGVKAPDAPDAPDAPEAPEIAPPDTPQPEIPQPSAPQPEIPQPTIPTP